MIKYKTTATNGDSNSYFLSLIWGYHIKKNCTFRHILDTNQPILFTLRKRWYTATIFYFWSH